MANGVNLKNLNKFYFFNNIMISKYITNKTGDKIKINL